MIITEHKFIQLIVNKIINSENIKQYEIEHTENIINYIIIKGNNLIQLMINNNFVFSNKLYKNIISHCSDEETIEIFLQNNYSPDYLFEVSLTQNINNFKLLVKYGANINNNILEEMFIKIDWYKHVIYFHEVFLYLLNNNNFNWIRVNKIAKLCIIINLIFEHNDSDDILYQELVSHKYIIEYLIIKHTINEDDLIKYNNLCTFYGVNNITFNKILNNINLINKYNINKYNFPDNIIINGHK
jgi:hypothetical protein